MTLSASGAFAHDPLFAASPAAAEKRRERRHVVDEPVHVYPPGFAPRTWKAHIRDISTRGMQLLLDEELAFGRQIRIRWRSHEVRGVILYQHKYDSDRYRVGIELLASSDTLLVEILSSQSHELREAKRRLEQQWENLNRTIGWLDLISDALIVTSADGTILLWNDGAQSLYGWTREEAIGRYWNELVASRDDAGLHRRKNGSTVLVTTQSTTQQETTSLPEIVAIVSRPYRSSVR
jgi:PAS domain S-box-containing protein